MSSRILKNYENIGEAQKIIKWMWDFYRTSLIQNLCLYEKI